MRNIASPANCYGSCNSQASVGVFVGKQYWYAVYTRPRHEKKIYEQLLKSEIEAFLPLQTTIRQWSDRRKKVTEPLFRCYVFVHILSQQYYKVLSLHGVVRYVTFEGRAVAIPDRQIQLVRNLLDMDIAVQETSESLPISAKVEVMTGPLTGVCGELIENAGKKRMIIRIEEINKVLLVNVPLTSLRLKGHC